MSVFLSLLMLAAPIEVAQQMPLQPVVPKLNPEEFSRVVGPLVFPAPVVGRIRIEGNNITREGIIRRELTFGPGDTLYQEAVEKTRKAILSTGAFGSVNVKAVDPDAEKSDVVITVAERRFPLPYPIVGIDASTGFYLGAGALYPNLFGRALHVDVGGEIGFRFSTPRWKGYTYLGFPLTHSRWHAEGAGYDFSYFWRKDAEIVRSEHRVSYEQKFRILRPLVASLEVGFLQTKAFGKDSDTPLPTFSPDTVDRSVFLHPAIELDLRDEPADPQKGLHAVAEFYYNPGFTEGFQTQRACSLSVAGYIPVGKNVLAANLWTYQQLDSIPVYRTLYVGHCRVVRGWADTTQVGPSLSVASLELRRWLLEYPLPFLGGLKLEIGGNLFFDIGAAHQAGLPPLYLAKPREDPHDGLLMGTGFGIALEAAGMVVKAEIAYGIGSQTGALAFLPVPIRFPVYFGWRF